MTTGGAGPGPAGAGSRVPRPLAAAAVLVALEGVAGLAYGLYLGLRSALDRTAESVLGAELGALIFVVGGAVLLACARGLLRARGWSRGPAVTVQLFGLAAGVTFLGVPGAGRAVGLVAAAVAVGVLAGLLSPAARAAFDYADDDEGGAAGGR